MDSEKNKPHVSVSMDEEALVERQVMSWINTYPDKPGRIDLGNLAAGKSCIAVFADEGGAFFEKRYITGGHMAVYPFSVVRRIIPGESPDMRLEAMELLNRLGAWATANRPKLPGKLRTVRVEPTSRGKFAGVGNDGDEDYEIKIKLTYEVI